MKKSVHVREKKILAITLLVVLVNLFVGSVFGQTPVPMSTQPSLTFTETFNAISTWSNNFTGSTSEIRWKAIGSTSGTIPAATAVSTTTVFTTGSTGGVQKGTNNIVFLSTGTSPTTSSTAADFFMDFTGVNAGTLSFDAAMVANGTGDRGATLKVFWSINGTTWTELTTTNLPFSVINTVTNNVTFSGLALPSAFNNSATARLRFYYYNGPVAGTSGSRPKISVDNLVVTATSTGCSTAPTSVSITPSATSLCSGLTLTLTGAATGATSYSWAGPNGFTSTALTPASFTVSALSAGIYTLSATNSCGTTTATTPSIAITTTPTAVSATPSATTLCSGNTLTLTGAATGAISYVWTGPNSFTSTQLNPPSFSAVAASSGIYTLVASNSCGTTMATSASVSVTAGPTLVSITPSATTLCSGTTLTLTGAATGATSYSWSGPNSFTSTDLSPASFTAGTAATGIYTLSATNSCGTTSVTSTSITVYSMPSGVSATPSATTLCSGATLTLTGAATGASTYSWSGPGAFTSTSLSPASFTVSAASAGIYTLTASTGICSVTATTAAITVNPLPSPGLSGTTTISSGGSATLTFSGTSGDVVYYWNGASTVNTTISGAGTSTVSVSPAVTTTYSVTSASSALGCSQTVSGIIATVTISTVADTTPTRDDNMAMGNPSSATTSTSDANNYLMVKSQYALAYNNAKGEPNWVSWHLSRAWKGSALRCDCFSADTDLPSGYFAASTSNYSGTGFDRGHLCPSDDRDGSDTDNAVTFKMTNMTPQAPNMNQITWESLESYCRSLIYSGNELYIIAGGYGSGGTGSLGGTTTTIAGTSITVPNRFFKVIVVLPVGTNDVSRVSNTTRVIAVDMPNNQTVNAHPWTYYRTSVDAIEAATGYDFLSNVSTGIQAVVEAGIDNGPSNILAWDFNGANSDTVVVASATSIGSNLDLSSAYNKLSRGASAAASTGANSFRTTGFQNNGISTSNTDYFETKMKAAAGYQLSLSSIDATFAGTTSFCASPGVNSQFAYSLDGTAFTLIGSPTTNVGTPSVMGAVNLSGISALQNVSSTTTIYLRYYASGQTPTGGWGFYSQYTGNHGLSIDGTTTPEPCVTPPTAVSAGLSSGTVCTGTAITLSGAATSVGPVTYSWAGPNSFTATDLNPAAITTSTASAGIYTLTATNGCGSTTATTASLTVNTAPTAVTATPSPLNVCSGSTLTLTGAATGGTSYSWSGPDGFTSTDLSPAAFTTNTASAGIYTLVATNTCGSTTATSAAVTITTGLPTVAAITGSTTVVAGSTITLANATPSGTWASINTAIATINASGVVTGVAAGIDTLTYAVTNACGTTTVSYTITVTAAPVVLVGWNVSTMPGGTNNFGTSPLAATTTAANVTVVTGLTRGSGVSTTGTGAARGWGGVDWQNTSVATAVTGNDFVTTSIKANSGYALNIASATLGYRRSSTGAQNGELQYSLDGTTYVFASALSYTSTVGTGATIAGIDLSGIAALQNVPAATTVRFRIVNYAGTASTGSWYVFDAGNSTADDLFFTGIVAPGCTVAPTAVSATPSATTVCSGAALTLTGAATNADSYAWSGPNSFTSTAQNPAAITTSAASAGIYTLVATNTCGSTTVTTTAITITTPPTAVSAGASATSLCSGQALTLTGAATGATTYSWSGPNSFTATDANPAAITTSAASAGIYTLTATNSCGSSTATTTSVTVLAAPAPSIAGTTTIVYGGTTTLTFTGAAGDVVYYSWTGGSSAVTTLDGAGAASVSVSPLTTTTYTIDSARSSAGCFSIISGASATITVGPACATAPTPVSANLSATAVCVGSPVTLSGSATSSGPTTYSWSGPGGYTSTDLNPAAITTTLASAGIYTLVATNACGSTTATTAALAINTTPTGVSATPSATTLCSGTTLTLTGTATGATSYSWSGPNAYTATNLSPVSFTVTTLSSGIYTLTATNSCGSAVATTASVTVTGSPTVAAIAGTTSVSIGSTISLTNATPSGTWGSLSTGIATINASGVVTGVATGSATITYAVTNSCGTTAVSYTVSVTPVPVTLVGWNVSTMPGGTNNFGTSPLAATTTATNLSVITGLTRGSGVSTTGTGAARGWGGVDWQNTSVANAVAGNDFVTTAIKANTGYQLNITSATVGYRRSGTGAQNGELQYSLDGTTYVFASALSYTSTSGSGATISGINLSGIAALQNVPATTTVTFRIVNYAATAAAGTWYVYDVAGSSADDLFFTGSLTPACAGAPTAVTATPSATALCSGAALTLTGAATDAVSYSWSGPNSFTSTSLNPAAFTTSTASAGIYTLVASNGCGSTTATTTAVVINTAPTAVSATPSATTVCSGAALTLTGAATGATSYSWSGPDGFTSTDLNPAAITTSAASAGVYSLTATNSCGNTTAVTSAINISNGPTAVSANAPAAVCNGSALTLTGAATNATTYSWSGPDGYTSTDLNPASFTATTASAGIYTLVATNACGSTSVTTSAVTINVAPTSVSATASSATLCSGSTLTLTGAATDATSYSWSGPDGFTSTDLNPAAITTGTASAGIYTLSATNSCGSTTATTTPVTVNSLPTPTIAGTATILIGASTTLTFTGNAGDVVYYSYTGGGLANTTIGVSGTNTVTVSPATTTTYTIDSARSAAGCFALVTGQNATITIDLGCTVAPTAVSAALSSTTVCSGDNITLTGTATNGTSYSWSGPGAYTSTDLNPASFATTVASAGIYTLVATNACGSTTVTTTALVVNPLPTAVSATPSATALCSGNTLTLTGTATNATSYSWSGPNGFTSTNLTPASFTVTTLSAGIYTLTATNSCGSVVATTASVTVTGSPTVAAISGSSTVAVGSNIALTDATPSGVWASGNTAVATVSASGSVRGVSAGTVFISYTVTNSCGSTTVTRTITVTAVPTSLFITWDPVSNGQSAGSPWAPATISSNITSPTSGMVRGGSFGFGAATGCYGGGVVSGTWASSGGTSAADATSAWFSITSSCNTISLSSIQGATRRSGSGPTSANIYYAIGSATTYTFVGTWTTSATSGTTGTPGSSSLTGISALQNIAPGTVVKFIITPIGTTGNWYLTSSNFSLTGTAVATAAPFAAVSPSNVTVVAGASTTFSASSVTGATSYQWQRNTSGTTGGTWTNITAAGLDGGSIYSGYTTTTTASSNTLSLTGVTNTLNGYGYRCAITNCAGTTFTSAATLTVGCVAAPTAVTATPSSATLCAGASLTLTSTATGATSYSWTGPDGFTSTVQNPAAITTSTASAGIYTLVASNTCGSTTATTTAVTINVAPSAVSATPSATTLCSGSALTLTGAATSATAYSWVGPNGFTSTAQNPAAITTSTASAGIYTLTATNSCGTATATTTAVTIDPPPAPSIAGTAIILVGSSTTITFTGNTGDVVYYSWTGGSSANTTIGVSGSSTITVSPAATTTYTIDSAISATGCFAAITGLDATITVDLGCSGAPTAVSANLSAAAVCVGDNITLSGAATGALSYSWAGPDGYTSSDLNPVTFATSTLSAGIYTLTATNSCGSTTATTAALIINTAPTAVSATPSATTLCSGTTLTLTATATDATSYSWSGPSGFTSTDNPASLTTAATSAGIYTLSAINSCGTTTTTTTSITVSGSPVVAAISGATSVSIGSTITLTNTTPSGVWSSANTSIATVSAGGGVRGISAGGTNISYTVTNACGTTSVTQLVSVSPPAIILVGWDVSAMPGGTNNFGTSPLAATTTAANVTVTQALTRGSGVSTTGTGAGRGWGGVDWTNTSVASAVSGNDFVSTAIKANTGYAINISSATINYRRSGTGATTGELQYSLDGTTYVFASALSYSSTASTGATISGINLSSISALQNVPSTTTVRFRIVNYNASGATGTWYIFDQGISSAEDFFIQGSVVCGGTPAAGSVAGSTAFCGSGSTTLSFTPVASGTGISYQWNSGSTPSSFTPIAGATNTTYTTPVVTSTTYYNVTTTCGYSGLSASTVTDTVAITPIPATPAPITGITTLCAGNGTTLSDTSAGGIWSSSAPAIATINATGNVTALSAGSATISYTVSNSCGTAYATTPFTVNPAPDAGTIAGAATACVGTSTLFTDTAAGGIWSSSDPSVASIDAGGLLTAVSPGVATISYIVTNGCGSDTATTAITISTSASAGTITGILSVCPGTTTTLFNGTAGGTWSSADNAIATITSGGVVTGVSAGTVTISYTVTTSCGTATATESVVVNPTLSAPPAITGTMAICPGTNTTLSNATTGGSWSSGDVAIATINAAGVAYGLAPGTTTITYTVTNVCGSAYTTTLFTVNPLPTVGAISGAATVCVGTTTSLSDTTTGGTWTSATPAVATVDAATGVVYGVATGTSVISYAVTNACGTTIVSTTITVNTVPVVTPITGTTTIFNGASATLSSTPAGGIWASANTVIATVSGTGVVTGTGLGVTTISYTATNACGSATRTTSVTVNTPVTPATAFWNFTAGTSAAASSSSVNVPASGCLATIGNTNGSVTAISSTSASTFSGASGTNNIGNAAFTGTISSASSYIQFTLTPNSGYYINVTGMSFGYRCTGTGPQGYTVKSSVDGYSSVLSTGTLSNGGTWTFITPTFTSTTTGAASAPVTIRVYGHNGTGGATASTINWRMDDITVNFTANPNTCSGTPAAGAISGATAFCGSGATTLTFTPGSTTPGTYYQWSSAVTGTSAFTPIAGATSTTYTTPTLTDTTSYKVTTTCSYSGLTSSTAAADVTINPLPAITLGATPTVCQPTTSATVAYSGLSGGATTYSLNWDTAANTAGFTDVSGAALSGTITLNIPATGAVGTFNGSVTVSNGICPSASYPVDITVLAYPTATISSINVPCTGYAGSVEITGTPLYTLSYMVDSGSVVTGTISGAGTYSISTGIISGPHNYTLTNVSNAVCNTLLDTVAYVNPQLLQWVGGTLGHESEWNYASNWSCNIVPSVTDNVTIGAATYAPAIATGDVMNTRNLTLLSGAALLINNGATLNVKGTLDNNSTVYGQGKMVLNNTTAQTVRGTGTVNNLELDNSAGATIEPAARLTIGNTLYVTSGTLTTNDSLELASSDTMIAARIASIPSTGAAISGKVKVDQYVQGGYRRYRFWSHPFSDTISLGQLQNYIDITGTGGAANGFRTTASNAPSAYRLDVYTSNSALGYDPGWKAFTRINATAADSNKLHPYQGIRLFFRGAKGEGLGYTFGYTPSPITVKMLGNVNQGPQTVMLSRGSIDPANQDYNLTGNPYPSPVDIGTILYNAKVAGQITGSAFYVWEPSIGTGGQYMSIDLGTTAAIPYYLQAYAAFQVRAHHDGAVINFNETDKVATIDNYLFKAPADNVTLNVYDASYHLFDRLKVKFNDAATDNEDGNYDATKRMGADFVFYSTSQEGRKLSIDARPYAADKVIPLGINSAYAKEFIIKAENVAVPAGGMVYLHDKLLQRTIELNAGTEYRFSITNDQATQGDQRFELGTKPAAATTKGLTVSMSPNPATDDVKITFTSGAKEEVSVRVLDMSGVSIYTENFGMKQNGTVTVPLSNFASGVYMVEFTQGTQKTVKRLVKE